jgi:hypothetical protein
MTHLWIEADFCVLFILVFLLAPHEAFPVFPNAHFVAAAEVNRMLLRFLTRQRVCHEHARATIRETAAPFATLSTLASNHMLLMHPALHREKNKSVEGCKDSLYSPFGNFVLRPNTSVAAEFTSMVDMSLTVEYLGTLLINMLQFFLSFVITKNFVN